MILFSFPTSGNISWPFMIGTVVLLLVYYFGWARTRFQGPQVQGAEAELTELEREFEQAAEHLGGTTAGVGATCAAASRGGARLVASEGRPVPRPALCLPPSKSDRARSRR